MKLYLLIFFICLPLTWQLFPGTVPEEGDYRHIYPKLCLTIRSYESYDQYSLSYILGLIEELQYPKDRIHVSFLTIEVQQEDSSQTSLTLLKK